MKQVDFSQHWNQQATSCPSSQCFAQQIHNLSVHPNDWKLLCDLKVKVLKCDLWGKGNHIHLDGGGFLGERVYLRVTWGVQNTEDHIHLDPKDGLLGLKTVLLVILTYDPSTDSKICILKVTVKLASVGGLKKSRKTLIQWYFKKQVRTKNFIFSTELFY